MSKATAIIGIDLGGTTTKTGLLVADTLTHVRTFVTKSYRPRDDILKNLTHAVKGLQAAAESDGLKVIALGVGVPATVDLSEGQTLIMPNFAQGWFGFGLVDYLRRATGLPAALINDARAFVLAESALGAGRGYSDVFGMILGTGVGGGVVLGGKVHFGQGALAGEIGHHIVEPHGARCGCGSVGCLETVASAPALVASVTRAYLHGRSPVLFERTNGDLNAISAAHIAQAARDHDAACVEALERVGTYLGIATANVMTLLAPQCLVIGGGLAGAHDLLFPVIEQVWRRHLQVVGDHTPVLEVATLEQPGVVGAALYAEGKVKR